MRAYLPPAHWSEGQVTLDRDESHYLIDVLRVADGQTLELFDGAGRTASGLVTERRKHAITLEVGAAKVVGRPTPGFHLVQALPKAQKMDLIVQKATELGVDRICPVSTDHAVMRVDERRGEKKTERWQKVALSACRQCGAAWAPVVDPIRSLSDWIEATPADCILVGDLREGAEKAQDVIEPLRETPPASIAFLIGPEGDFSPGELDRLGTAGARFVNLGDTVLRTETAAIYALSLLRYGFR